MALKVRDVMIKKIITTKPEDSIQRASMLMRKNRVGCLIVTKDKNPIGIVTESDIIKKVVAESQDASKTKVVEVMAAPLVFGNPDDDLAETSKKMIKSHIKRLPIIENEKLVGILTDTDIVRVSPDMINLLEERLKVKDEEIALGAEEETSGLCELCGNYSDALRDVNDRWVCDDCKNESAEL